MDTPLALAVSWAAVAALWAAVACLLPRDPFFRHLRTRRWVRAQRVSAAHTSSNVRQDESSGLLVASRRKRADNVPLPQLGYSASPSTVPDRRDPTTRGLLRCPTRVDPATPAASRAPVEPRGPRIIPRTRCVPGALLALTDRRHVGPDPDRSIREITYPLDDLTRDQAYGFACPVCGISFVNIAADHVAVGTSERGTVYACARHRLPPLVGRGWTW